MDKSREMLATYMVLLTFLWRCLTKSHEEFKIGSRLEDVIDKSGDVSTLFEKLRFNLVRLPDFLLPRGWDTRKHTTYMKILNPELGGSIVGEAQGKSFAHGDRRKAIFFDEFQDWPDAEESWKSASDATRCKIIAGTPKGAGNKFAELARTDEVKQKLRLWWYLSPEKAQTSKTHIEEKVKRDQVYDKVGKYVIRLKEKQDSAPSGCYVDQHGKVRSEWYDKECERRSAEDIAENLDISYLTTGRPVFDTIICEQRKAESAAPSFVGDLVWLVRPVFREEDGYCKNMNQLKVDFVPNVNGLYRIWEKPQDGYANGYVIGADTAEGLIQGDFDAATVLARFSEKPRVVAVLHGHLKIHEYAEELAKLAVFYERAALNVERNNHGHGVILELFKTYQNLWHKEIFTKGYPKTTDKIGFDTTSMSKPIIIGTLGKAISGNEYSDPDETFWKETLTFVEDNGSMEAQGKSKGQRCYDDRVMSRAITLWTHLNMPLPAKIRKKEELKGWRRAQLESNNSQKLVRWTVGVPFDR
jgi:hypothetical protein